MTVIQALVLACVAGMFGVAGAALFSNTNTEYSYVPPNGLYGGAMVFMLGAVALGVVVAFQPKVAWAALVAPAIAGVIVGVRRWLRMRRKVHTA